MKSLVVAIAAGALCSGFPCFAKESEGHSAPAGYLKVFSATEAFNDADVYYYSHSSYRIFSSNGKLLRAVENRISVHDEEPALVALPHGVYYIDAQSEEEGNVRVRTNINAGRITTLDLEKHTSHGSRQ